MPNLQPGRYENPKSFLSAYYDAPKGWMAPSMYNQRMAMAQAQMQMENARLQEENARGLGMINQRLGAQAQMANQRAMQSDEMTGRQQLQRLTGSQQLEQLLARLQGDRNMLSDRIAGDMNLQKLRGQQEEGLLASQDQRDQATERRRRGYAVEDREMQYLLSEDAVLENNLSRIHGLSGHFDAVGQQEFGKITGALQALADERFNGNITHKEYLEARQKMGARLRNTDWKRFMSQKPGDIVPNGIYQEMIGPDMTRQRLGVRPDVTPEEMSKHMNTFSNITRDGNLVVSRMIDPVTGAIKEGTVMDMTPNMPSSSGGGSAMQQGPFRQLDAKALYDRAYQNAQNRIFSMDPNKYQDPTLVSPPAEAVELEFNNIMRAVQSQQMNQQSEPMPGQGPPPGMGAARGAMPSQAQPPAVDPYAQFKPQPSPEARFDVLRQAIAKTGPLASTPQGAMAILMAAKDTLPPEDWQNYGNLPEDVRNALTISRGIVAQNQQAFGNQPSAPPQAAPTQAVPPQAMPPRRGALTPPPVPGLRRQPDAGDNMVPEPMPAAPSPSDMQAPSGYNPYRPQGGYVEEGAMPTGPAASQAAPPAQQPPAGPPTMESAVQNLQRFGMGPDDLDWAISWLRANEGRFDMSQPEKLPAQVQSAYFRAMQITTAAQGYQPPQMPRIFTRQK